MSAPAVPDVHRPPSPRPPPRPRRPSPGSVARGLLELARPGQWSKNVLVLAVPAAAGVVDHGPVLVRSLVVFVAFVLASVAVYAVNDVRDAALDRAHPVKRFRPVASGLVAPPVALGFAAVSATAALALASALDPLTTLVLASYLGVSVLYSLRLKHVAVLDVVAVASGFVLRALSGAAANHLAVSNWFLLVSLFGALFVVSGKRSAEAVAAEAGATDEIGTRPVLEAYPRAYLAQLVTLSLGGTVMAYAMWAFQYLGSDVFRPTLAASFVPFLVVMLRYGLLLSQGQGERPERLLFRDRVLVGAGGVWALTVAGSLYLA